jgi:hypothetical protein
MLFIYSLCGWEGSAIDAHVYQDAQIYDLMIPKSKYYLTDAGYLSSQGLLISYHGVCYHLAQWSYAGVRSVIYTITVLYLFQFYTGLQTRKSYLTYIIHQLVM